MPTEAMQQLQNTQYQPHSILRYEQIFGEGFLSPGGLNSTAEFCRRLTWQPGLQVLDIGSGLGGAAFYMARHYQAAVTGLDLAPEVLEIALQRLAQQPQLQITFLQGNALELEFDRASFDIIWSRDTFLHIADKSALFNRLVGWLKPGGQLLITDYAGNDGQAPSDSFQKYIDQSGYHLLPLAAYGDALTRAGFGRVTITDNTSQFLLLLQQEKQRLLTNAAAFLQNFTQQDLDYLAARWQMKIDFCQAGDMKWGLFRARVGA